MGWVSNTLKTGKFDFEGFQLSHFAILGAEWVLFEFIRISACSDTNVNFHTSPSAAVAGHSCHPPNPHFVTRPILISFSHDFLLVFLISTFMIFPKAYFSVVLTNSSVFADA